MGVLRCKRSSDQLISDMTVFDGRIERFLSQFPEYTTGRIERVSLAPDIPENIRQHITSQGRMVQDLHDLTLGL